MSFEHRPSAASGARLAVHVSNRTGDEPSTIASVVPLLVSAVTNTERCMYLGYIILAFSTTALVFVLFALACIVRWRGGA
jgi:hypothetical protein